MLLIKAVVIHIESNFYKISFLSLFMDYVEHKWINPNTIERRLYQETILSTAIRGNTLVVLPTGLGKTPIAAMLTAYRLEMDMNKKILFMAPTKPLVEQHKKSFERFLKIGPDELKVLTGTIPPEKRKELYKSADIVFSTPQTIKNDLVKGCLNLENFSLLVFDEAHHSVGNYAYTYIAKKYVEQSGNPLILALTASPGGKYEKVDEIKKRLFIDYVEIRTRNDPDVKPYIKQRKEEYEEVELSSEQKQIKVLLEEMKAERLTKLEQWGVIDKSMRKTELLKIQNKLAKSSAGFKYAALSILAEAIKIDHGLILLETQCLYALRKYFEKILEEGSNGFTKAAERISSDKRFLQAYSICDRLVRENSEHPKIRKLVDLVHQHIEAGIERIIIFAQFRDTISSIYNALKSIPFAKPVEFIGQAKRSGKGLSQKEQVQILNEFKLGVYNVLIASQVGEEGLDVTETDLVIFYEPVPSGIRKIQRAGRTGRTKTGKIIVLVTKDTRDKAYYWSAHHKERKMERILKVMKSQQSLTKFGGFSENHNIC